MTYIEAIALRLAGLLQAQGWTQQRFARKTGVSRMTINGTLRARVKIVTFDKLMIYCSALGITLGEFFTHELFFAELSKEV